MRRRSSGASHPTSRKHSQSLEHIGSPTHIGLNELIDIENQFQYRNRFSPSDGPLVKPYFQAPNPWGGQGVRPASGRTKQRNKEKPKSPVGHRAHSPCGPSFPSCFGLGTRVRLNGRQEPRRQGQPRPLITIDRSPRTHILIIRVTDTNACLGAPCLCSESSWIVQLTIAFPAKALEVPYS